MAFNARAAASTRGVSNKNMKDTASKNDDESMSLLLVDKNIIEAFATKFADTIAASIGGFTSPQKEQLIITIVDSVSNYLCDHPQYNSNGGFKEWTKLDGGSICDEVVQEAFTKFMLADNSNRSHASKPQEGLKHHHHQQQRQPEARYKKIVISNDKENNSNKDKENNSAKPKCRSLKARVNRCRKFQSFNQQQYKGATTDSK